jgi:hypothetical protein
MQGDKIKRIWNASYSVIILSFVVTSVNISKIVRFTEVALSCKMCCLFLLQNIFSLFCAVLRELRASYTQNAHVLVCTYSYKVPPIFIKF